MKFTKGYWMTLPNVTIHGAQDLRHCAHDGLTATLAIAPKNIDHRGQTLEGPLLTVEVSAPRKDILRIKTYHFLGGVIERPAFDLHCDPQPLQCSEEADGITITAGDMRLTVQKRPFAMTFYHQDRLLTRSDSRQLAYITTDEGAFVRERLDLNVGETLYGLGERFTAFCKNGQSADVWNEDGGTASEYAYKNVPFYLSSKGYGVFVNHPECVSFELGSEAVSKAQFSVPGEQLDYMVIGGGSMRSAIARYTALTGKPPMPPAWSFGLWLSTSFTTDYNEETVNRFIDGMLERNIPFSVFHFDCFWMKEYEWCSFAWDEAQFPDVQGMLSRLRAKGLRLCVWINPYIGQKSPLFKEAMTEGYLLHKPDGGVWQTDLWQPGMGIVDFTNPAAARWYQDKLEALLDMGIDAFKTDFGERIPTDVRYHSGECPQKMHNYYTQLYNRCVFELLERKRGKNEAVLFARSATVGGQQFPVHWGGDCYSNYVSMAESLRGGLSLALGGFAFWSHDIGGFEATASADVYKRWIAFGLLSTHSRLHGSSSYRVPWLYDEESVDVLRHFVKNKHRLMPYIYAQSIESCAEGIPVMRPMVMAFPADPACAYLDRQYMLGESLLVAPVFAENGVCEYYLPQGTFTHLLSGERRTGPGWFTESYDFFSLPLFVRENTLLPLGDESQAVYDYADSAVIHVYDVTAAGLTLYNPDNRPALCVKASRRGSELTLLSSGEREVQFVLHNLKISQPGDVVIPKGQTVLRLTVEDA